MNDTEKKDTGIIHPSDGMDALLVAVRDLNFACDNTESLFKFLTDPPSADSIRYLVLGLRDNYPALLNTLLWYIDNTRKLLSDSFVFVSTKDMLDSKECKLFNKLQYARDVVAGVQRKAIPEPNLKRLLRQPHDAQNPDQDPLRVHLLLADEQELYREILELREDLASLNHLAARVSEYRHDARAGLQLHDEKLFMDIADAIRTVSYKRKPDDFIPVQGCDSLSLRPGKLLEAFKKAGLPYTAESLFAYLQKEPLGGIRNDLEALDAEDVEGNGTIFELLNAQLLESLHANRVFSRLPIYEKVQQVQKMVEGMLAQKRIPAKMKADPVQERVPPVVTKEETSVACQVARAAAMEWILCMGSSMPEFLQKEIEFRVDQFAPRVGETSKNYAARLLENLHIEAAPRATK